MKTVNPTLRAQPPLPAASGTHQNECMYACVFSHDFQRITIAFATCKNIYTYIYVYVFTYLCTCLH